MAKDRKTLRDQAFVRRLYATGRHDELDKMLSILLPEYMIWYSLDTGLINLKRLNKYQAHIR